MCVFAFELPSLSLCIMLMYETFFNCNTAVS